jgi:SpoVK/Ycf46/Vps4 family AAA+-type ATPase
MKYDAHLKNRENNDENNHENNDENNHENNDENNHENNHENKDEKTNIDLIIERININFDRNNFRSSNFNGISFFDYKINNNNINDQNIYAEADKNLNKYVKKPNSNFVKLNKQNNSYEFINIDVEISTLDDILTLIKKYKNDPNIKYNINMLALHNIKEPLEELNNMIGMKELKNSIVEQIIYFIQELHKNKNGDGEFMHTVIYGPPGTGKTEIAKIIGKIFSKIGLLRKNTFKKVTRSDLIAGYLGQTALKTQDVIKESLGGVLFIDEAYSLGNPDKRDSFSKECIDTLCEALSDNKDNLMVIIAGYEKELKDCFFSYNQGLDSRFTWRFKTDDYSGEDLYNIFMKKVNDIGWTICDDSGISADWFKKNKEYFKFYGRDIETVLAKTKMSHSKRIFCKPECEKKKINIKDLEKGFEIYLKNEDVKNRKESDNFKKYLYNTMYC